MIQLEQIGYELENVEAEIKEAVLKAVNKAAGLETNGKGIAFSLPVSDVVGA